MTVTDEHIRVGDLELRVCSEGEGSPLVVLHGFSGSVESMRGTSDALRSQHRVVRVDLIGHGRSDAPEPVECYAMEQCIEQLDQLCDHLAIEGAHWLGYSMGGRSALCMAALRPARVRSLLLIGASAGLENERDRAARVLADRALADRIEREGVEAFVDHWMALPLFASQKRLGGEFLERARAQRLRNRARGLANSLRGMGTGAQPPVHDRLAHMTLPVCLVVGDEDAKFRTIAERLAAGLPDARVEIVPQSGHAAHLENPRAFADLARRFLAQADVGGVA